ncbi:MAG TPA: LLM class F420-dependent oxidoreductase [Acidimicrobiales bacterium]|nr:LLM class F420-dependent oxidoreductase [Acidimicrobiales bacterium]
MQLRIFTEPQEGATYDQLVQVAKVTEETGFDAFFRSDHYLKIFSPDHGPGPSDAWITLAGIARETRRIRLGTLVTPATFRLPGPLAITVANVDAMSGGRVELGLGSGWYDDEHHAYGIPYPELGERFDRLEEQLEIVTGLWSTAEGETFSYDGRHYQLKDSPALPKPAQRPGPPIVIGGGGPKRTPRLAARFGAEFNLPFSPISFFQEQCRRVRDACEAIGRDPDDLVYSAALVVACGSDDAEFRRRAEAIGRDPDDLRENAAGGTVAQVRDTLGRWAEAGAERVYLQVLDLDDLDHIRLLGAEVLPAVRG